MKIALLVSMLFFVALLALGVVLALYQHKRRASGKLQLIGEIGAVNDALDPEGTVIVGGELWRARANDGSRISTRTQVRIVGFDGHLALVESYK